MDKVFTKLHDVAPREETEQLINSPKYGSFESCSPLKLVIVRESVRSAKHHHLHHLSSRDNRPLKLIFAWFILASLRHNLNVRIIANDPTVLFTAFVPILQHQDPICIPYCIATHVIVEVLTLTQRKSGKSSVGASRCHVHQLIRTTTSRTLPTWHRPPCSRRKGRFARAFAPKCAEVGQTSRPRKQSFLKDVWLLLRIRGLKCN